MSYRFSILLLAAFLASCATPQVGVERQETQRTEVREQTLDQEGDVLYQILLGEMAGRMGQLDTASSAYIGAAFETDDPLVAQRATHIALYGRDYPNALKAAQRWEALAPESSEAQQILATLHARLGNIDEAVIYFETIIVETEEQANGGFKLVGNLLSQDIPEKNGLAVIERLVALHEDEFDAHFTYAALAQKWGDYPRALKGAEKALTLDPADQKARLLRNQAWMELGEIDRALNDMVAMIGETPEDGDLRLAYAQMLVKDKRYDQAREQFEYVSSRQPDNADLLYTLGLLNVEIQQYDDATTYLLKAMELGKHIVESSYYLGRISESQEQYKEAISWYLRVSEGQYAIEAQLRIAVMLAKLGHLDKAQEHLARMRLGLDSVEQRVNLYLMEGSLLEEAKQYRQGMSLYTRALDEQVDNVDLLYARAMLAEKMDRIDLMEADLNLILDKDPGNATALNALGYTLADRTDRYQEALVYIEQALEQRPDDPAVIDSMGWVQYRMGNLDEAERYLRQAHSMLDDAEIAGHLAEVMWISGRREEALRILEEALQKFPDSPELKSLKRRIDK